MTITLYRNMSPNNYLTKTLQGAKTVEALLVEQGVDVTSFQARIQTLAEMQFPQTLPNYNYAYIPDFKRYYYVKIFTRDFAGTGAILQFDVDVLMSFKTDILSSRVVPSRNYAAGNKMIYDSNVRMTVQKNITYQKFPETPFDGQAPIVVVQGPSGPNPIK